MAVAVAALVAKFVAALAVGGAPCLLPPVTGRVIDPFRPPDCSYCAGNRGIEYATTAGSPVRAAAAGSVSFAGVVAGTRYVVVDHGGGYRTTYGRLAAAAVSVGSRVSAGAMVGTSGSQTFFGLRLGETYLDPAPHLATTVPQPRLVPLDGRHRLPPPPAKLAC